MKRTFFSINNPLTTLKAIIVSLVTSLILLIPAAVAYWFVTQGMLGVGRIIQVIILITSLWIWGWLANKFWKWA